MSGRSSSPFGRRRTITVRQFLDYDYRMPASDLAKYRRLPLIDRLRFGTQLIVKYNVLTQDLTDYVSDDKVISCMLSYNDHIQCHRYREAIGFLNKAVACSVTALEQNDTLITRAHISFDVDEFDACMMNMQVASTITGRMLRLGPHERTFEAINFRLAKKTFNDKRLIRKFYDIDLSLCMPLEIIDRTQPPMNFAFDKAIRLQWTAVGEPSVVTTKAMAAGDALGIDNAICSVLYGPATNRRCTQCYTECPLTLIPCVRVGCTAMFCDNRCLDKAFNGAHHYECDITPFMRKHETCRPIVRIVVDAFKTKQDVIEMMAFAEVAEVCQLKEHNVFEYAELLEYMLPNNHNSRLAVALTRRRRRPMSIREHLYFTRLASVVYVMLGKRHYMLTDLFPGRLERRFLRKFIFEMAMMMAEYGYLHEMESEIRFKRELSVVVQPVAWCLYPVLAMLPHSCTPNVTVVPFRTNSVALFALRPIAAGEPLTIDRTIGTPGGNAFMHKLMVRSILGTDCPCPERDLEALPFPNEQSPCKTDLEPEALWNEDSVEMQQLFNRPRTRVLELVTETAAFLQSNDHLYPCRELCSAQRCFLLSMRSLIGPQLRYDFADDDLAAQRRIAEAKYLSDRLANRSDSVTSESASYKLRSFSERSYKLRSLLPWPGTCLDSVSEREIRARKLMEQMELFVEEEKRWSGDSSTDNAQASGSRNAKSWNKKHFLDVLKAGPPDSESSMYGISPMSSGSSSLREPPAMTEEERENKRRSLRMKVKQMPRSGVNWNLTDSESD